MKTAVDLIISEKKKAKRGATEKRNNKGKEK